MVRTISFDVTGDPAVNISAEETPDGKLAFTLSQSGSQIADLRGLFFHVNDESLLSSLQVSGADVTDQEFKANKVKNLGNGANVNGVKTGPFDVGIEFGSSGIGKDDIRSTSFVLESSSGPLTLDLIGLQDLAVRMTSVGVEGGSRGDSLKVADTFTAAPDAVNDVLTTDEDTAASLNILANDSDADGDALSVTDIEGGTVGSQFAVTTDAGRMGQVTVLADGTFAFDPDGGFEDLSTGEADSFMLDYTISDGNGGTDWAEVTVTVEGVNDPPVANDDNDFFVEFGDMATVDVAANDTDVDGTIDPSSLVFAGADLGTAVEAGGQLKYTANTIDYDTTDSSANDGLTYTVNDNEGLTSNVANVTAKVIDPLRETDVDTANATNGQPITLSLSTEDRTFNDSSFVDVGITAGALDQPDINVSFVIDESGSINNAQFIQEQQAVQNTIDLLRINFGGTGTDVEIQIVDFANGASSQSYDLFDTALDDVTTGTPIAIKSGGATNYEAALQQSLGFFSGNAGENFLLFTSDGQPTAGGSFTDEVTGLQNLNVSRTAVGFGSANLATLNQIDNTGGAEVLGSAADLGNAFAASPLFPADLLSFSLTVNGIVFADETALTDLGGGDFSLGSTLTSLSNGLGDLNTVIATASFDINKDGIAETTRTTQTVINGTDGSNITFV